MTYSTGTRQEREAAIAAAQERVQARLADVEGREPERKLHVWSCDRCGVERETPEAPTRCADGKLYCPRCAKRIEELEAIDEAAHEPPKPTRTSVYDLEEILGRKKSPSNQKIRPRLSDGSSGFTAISAEKRKHAAPVVGAERPAAEDEGTRVVPAAAPAFTPIEEDEAAIAARLEASMQQLESAAVAPSEPEPAKEENVTATAEAPAKRSGPTPGSKIAGVVAHAQTGLDAGRIADVMKLPKKDVEAHLSLARSRGWLPALAKREGPSRAEQVAELTREGKSRHEIAAALGITPEHVDTARGKARALGLLPPPDPAARARGLKGKERQAVTTPPTTPLEREGAASVALDGETQGGETQSEPAQEIERLRADRADLEKREAKVGEYEDGILRLEKQLADEREHTRLEIARLTEGFGKDATRLQKERDDARDDLAKVAHQRDEARVEVVGHHDLLRALEQKQELLTAERAKVARLEEDLRAALEQRDDARNSLTRKDGLLRVAERERDDAINRAENVPPDPAKVERLVSAIAATAVEADRRTRPVLVRKNGIEIELAGVEDVAQLVRLLA